MKKVVIEKEIKIIAGDKSYSLSYSQLKPEYNIEETIKEAFNYGKDEDLLSKYSLIKKTRKKEYKLAFKYDTAAVKELLDKIDKEVESEAVDATITIEAGNVKITEASHGRKLKGKSLR